MSEPMEFSGAASSRPSFFSHVFSTTEEGKAEILNISQYAVMAIIPVMVLNKVLQKYVPDADPDASSVEIVVEIMLQLVVLFAGMVIIHRIITFFPTYSGFRYEPFILTNAILVFMFIVFSLQTKIGMKAYILYDRVMEWTGLGGEKPAGAAQKKRPYGSMHSPSQADYVDDSRSVFPPLPAAGGPAGSGLLDQMIPTGGSAAPTKKETAFGPAYGPASTQYEPTAQFGPMAANSLLGSTFA